LDVLGGLWHLLNLYAPAAGIGLIASLLAKLLWRGELKAAPWLRMWLWSSACAAVACTAGLIFFGRDGKMATYVAMVLAAAASLWWFGFGPGRR